MSRWFRHYAGLCRDEKLVSVAIKAKQPIERVVWVWCAILESAAEIDDDGRYSFDPAEAAYFLRADEADILAIQAGLSSAGRLSADTVVKWGIRQFKSDKSADRVAAFRERKRAADGDDHQDGASRNDGVTLQTRYCNAPETETEAELDTERKKERERASAPPAPAFLPDGFEPDLKAAEAQGIPADKIQSVAAKFTAYQRTKRQKSADWQASWLKWCIDEAERRNWTAPNHQNCRDGPPMVRIDPITTPDAWQAWERHKGRKLPIDKQGGWSVPTLKPPQQEARQ